MGALPSGALERPFGPIFLGARWECPHIFVPLRFITTYAHLKVRLDTLCTPRLELQNLFFQNLESKFNGL